MDEVIAPPASNTIDPEWADAYAAFWQCLDATELTEPTRAVASDRDAYEQYWNWLDAD